MKLKELREIMEVYNPEVEFSFVVMQDDLGEGGENITIALELKTTLLIDIIRELKSWK
jgi:hypothetical protein